MSSTLQRQFWFAIATLAGLATLLSLTLLGLGGRVPDLRPLGGEGRVTPEWPSPAQVGDWFSVGELARAVRQTNAINPFFTRHFQPPPPPSTRRVTLTYQGSLESSDGKVRAFVLVDTNTLALAAGAVVVADHAVKSIALRTLILTNAAGQTNVLEFSVPKPLEVPIK